MYKCIHCKKEFEGTGNWNDFQNTLLVHLKEHQHVVIDKNQPVPITLIKNFQIPVKYNFEIGRLVATRGVSSSMGKSEEFSAEIVICLTRYFSKDWGDLCESDKQLNDEALAYLDEDGNWGSRLFSAYNTSVGKIYIITEYDYSVTTVLFADEY